MFHADDMLPKIMIQNFIPCIVEWNCDKNFDFRVSTGYVS